MEGKIKGRDVLSRLLRVDFEKFRSCLWIKINNIADLMNFFERFILRTEACVKMKYRSKLWEE